MGKKTEFVCALSNGQCGGEAGDPQEDAIIAAAAQKATAMFLDELKKAGVQPVGGAEGAFDRGGCGHDRSK